MSHTEKTVAHIFQHPISMNLKWNDVTHMFTSLGATVEPAHGGREKVKLNGQEMTFHVPHHNTVSSKEEVIQLRHFLERCGINPAPAKS